jgi:hypothetical protein
MSLHKASCHCTFLLVLLLVHGVLWFVWVCTYICTNKKA